MQAPLQRPVVNVLGVEVDAIDMGAALHMIEGALKSAGKGYVCIAGVHGVMEARRSVRLAEAYAGSLLTVPDGVPLVWVGRNQGHRAMGRVAGPDLMLEIFARPEFAEATHFLYGGTEGVAEELAASLRVRFPHARIVGTGMPPFRELNAEEEDALVERISALKPDIIWMGISCPKQEMFMARYLPRLETKLMFGVGAAFDYHTGRIRDCAPWVKRAGLQWMHRLLQDPRRLWKRYLLNNSGFVYRMALEVFSGRFFAVAAPRKAAPAHRHSDDNLQTTA